MPATKVQSIRRRASKTVVLTATAPSAEPFELEPPKLPPLLERDVSQQICDFLGYHGWMIIRLNPGTYVPARIAFALVNHLKKSRDIMELAKHMLAVQDNVITIGEEFDPDLLAIHPVYPAMFIEAKRPGGKASDGQLRRLDELRRAYHFKAELVDNIDPFIRWYEEHFPFPPDPPTRRGPSKETPPAAVESKAS